ncbi:MAG: alpha/beta fold hydrolase [Solirubrobacterales bacterium]
MDTQQAAASRQRDSEGEGDRDFSEAARERLQAGLPVGERRFELGGVSTNVLEGGDGPPVVLLHGPLANHWLRVVPGLVSSYRVITPDLPGHGRSEVTGDPLDAERVIAWLAELIERTCSSPPVLIGQTLGGAIAARFAAEHSDRLRGLMLVDSLGLAPFAPAPEFAGALNEFLAQPNERTHDHLWRYCAFDVDRVREQMGEDWDAFRAYNVDRARTPSVQAALGALMEHLAMPAISPAQLARIAVPTTLIWGREDLATPLAVAEEASDRFGWPLRVIEACADDPPVEQPEALLAAIRGVLEELQLESLQAAGGSA